MESGYIYVSDNVFPSLFAISHLEQQKGLMHQVDPPVMSFIYKTARINKFWMYQTPAELDIVFCLKGQIKQICKGESFSTKAIGNDEFSDLVLEFPYGTIKSCGIKVNDSVGIVKPSKEELDQIIKKNYSEFY